MAEQLGGISYPVKVEYDGAGVQNFIADLAAARAAFDDFKNGLGTATASINSITAARQKSTAATEEETGVLRENSAERKSASELGLKLSGATRQQIIDTQRLSVEEAKELVVLRTAARERATAAAALEKQARAAARAAEAQARLAAQATAAQNKSELQGIQAVIDKRKSDLQLFQQLKAAHAQEDAANRRQITAVSAVPEKLKEADGAAGLLNATILRLLIFREVVRLIQGAVAAFKDFIVGGVEFNAENEKTQLGIAGLLTSLTDVRNKQGELLDPARAFAANVQEGARQMKLLREEALKTGIGVAQLASNFEVSLGPGLAANLKIDEIRQLAVRIAQIAPAVNLKENQLAQEIRSLFQGNIRSQTDRIANIFHITSDDIRRAKQAGDLFKFLNDKFVGFQLAAQEVPNTFDGIIGRIQTMSELLSGQAASGFFVEAKVALKSFSESALFGKGQSATLESFKAIFDALTGILLTIEGIVKSGGLGTLNQTAKSFAAIITTVGTLAVGLVKGLVDGFNDVLTPLRVVAVLFGGSGESIAEIVALATEAFVVFKTWQIAVRPFLGLLTDILVKAVVSAAAFDSWLLPLAAAVVILALFRDKLAGLGGVNLPIVTTFKILGETLLQVFTGVAAGFATLVSGVVETVVGAVKFLVGFSDVVKQAFNIPTETLKIQQDIADRAKNILDFEKQRVVAIHQGNTALAEQLTKTIALQKSRNEAAQALVDASNAGPFSFDNTKDLAKKTAKTFDDLLGGLSGDPDKNPFAKKLNSLLAGAAKDPTLAQGATAIGALVRDGISSLIDLLPSDLKNALAKAKAEADSGNTRQRKDDFKATDQQADALRKTQEEAAVLQIQARALQQINALRSAGVSVQEIELVNAQQAQAIEEQKLVALKASSQIENDRLKAIVDGLDKGKEKDFAEAKYKAAVDKSTEAIKLQTAKVNETTAATLRLANLAGKNGIGAAFRQTFEDLSTKLPTVLQTGLDAAASAVSKFSDLVGSSIVDAFDPTKKVGLRERFAAFLQDIAKQIISTLTKIAITKAILGLTGLLGGGSGGSTDIITSGTVITRAAGGPVPQGLAGGGMPRPAGIPASDTVPAWLTPGEFVLPVHAVRRYGLAVMESLRRGSAAPQSVRAAAGVSSASAAALPPQGRALAGGGETADVAAAASHQAPTPAFLVANEQVMEMLLAGGQNAMLRFMRQHAAQQEAFQRRNRSQRNN